METNTAKQNEVMNPVFPSQKHEIGRDSTYLRHMPRDMTVERPHARIIRLILNDNMPSWPQHLHITALRVLHVRQGDAVPVARTFVEDGHVVAVEVHGLGSVSTGMEVKSEAKV